MNILLGYRQDWREGRIVESYARAVSYYLRQMGHTTHHVGEGHLRETLEDIEDLNKMDLFLEIDNGRNKNGEFTFIQPDAKLKIPSAVWLIDSHGQPDLHSSIAPSYDHVFFAVWFRRDLFASHPSAHCCPNATDTRWFFPQSVEPEFDFGFFGSKGGLDRADVMKEICEKNGWTYDVRQINGGFKHRWPFTAEAMGKCRYLFNHSQKHDGPNLRVMESMAVQRPLINDMDEKSGLDRLFQNGNHYLGYEAYTFKGLEEAMRSALDNSVAAEYIAYKAYEEVRANHLIPHRVKQILEVVGE